MRKIITLLFLAAFCICSQAYSQNRADELMKQAQESLAKKEYIKARYLFLQAYNAFSSQAKYDKAVECGVNASALYHRENYYKEAFELLRGAELLVTDGEQKSGKTMPDLRFRINKERLQMYINLKNPARAKEQLVKLEETAKAAKNDSLNNDLLYTQANYYYTAQDELNVLKRKYDDSLKTIEEKDSSLSAKQYIIIGLCILAGLLATALVLAGIVLLRFVLLTRKQKKAIQIANEHNELKTKFIQNISSQMEPTLNTLDTTLPGVRALKGFAEHIQELSDLESTLSEAYEMREININTFCESVMDKIKSGLKPDIATAVNAPKLSVKTNPEQLERILLHLLNNAAEFTPEGGKIWLDFKKRGAHTHQFIVSDTGSGIAEEEQADLFKPFTKVKDLTEGDGLGLPICSLIATKMNGSLTLDSSYTKGCRFVLELHT